MSHIRVNQQTVQSISAPQAKQTRASKKTQTSRGPTHVPKPATTKEVGTVSQAVSTTPPKQTKRKERKKTDTRDSSGATKGKATQSMQTAAGLVIYTNDEIKKLTRRNASTEEVPTDAHTVIQKRIQRGFDLTTSVLDGKEVTKPSKQDVADIMLFLDAKARASQSLSRSASFSIADPEGRLDKYLNSCESAHDGSAPGASSAQGRKLVHAIDFGNVAGSLASGKQSVAFGAFQIDGHRHLFLKALNQGYKINVETVKDTDARISATSDSDMSTPNPNGTSAPAPLASMGTSASAKADVGGFTVAEEQNFIANAYKTFQDAVAKAKISGLTCADQTEIYAMVKEVKTVITHANALTDGAVEKILLLHAVETFTQTWAEHGSNFSHLDRRIGDEAIFTLADLKDAKYANNLSAQSKEAISDATTFRSTILTHLRAQMGLAKIDTTSLPTQDGISSLVQDGAKAKSTPDKATPQSTVATPVADQGISPWNTVPAGFKPFSAVISTDIVQNTANGVHKNTCFILAPIRAMLENPAMCAALMNRIYQRADGAFCIKLKYMNKEYSVIVKPDDKDYKQYIQPDGRQDVVTALECAITRFYTTMIEQTHTYGKMGEASRVAGLLGLSNNVNTSRMLNNILRGSTTPQQKVAALLRILQQSPNMGFVLSSGDNGHFVQFKLTGDNNIQIGNSLTSRISETRAGVISSRQASTYTLTLDAFVRHMPSTAAISCYMLDEQTQAQAKASTTQVATAQTTKTTKPQPPSKPTVKSDASTVQPTITAKAKPTPPVTSAQAQVTLNDIINDFEASPASPSGYTRPRNTATASAQTATTSAQTATTQASANPIFSANANVNVLPSNAGFVALRSDTIEPAQFKDFITNSQFINNTVQRIFSFPAMQRHLANRVTVRYAAPTGLIEAFISPKVASYCIKLNGADGKPFYVQINASELDGKIKHPNVPAVLAKVFSKLYPNTESIGRVETIGEIVRSLGLKYATIDEDLTAENIHELLQSNRNIGVIHGKSSSVLFRLAGEGRVISVINSQTDDAWESHADYRSFHEDLAEDSKTPFDWEKNLTEYMEEYNPITAPRHTETYALSMDDFVLTAKKTLCVAGIISLPG